VASTIPCSTGCRPFVVASPSSIQRNHGEEHIRGCRELICLNDEEAKQKAIQILNGHDIEVWQVKRQVFTLRHAEGK
jgi:hypothetical protein